MKVIEMFYLIYTKPVQSSVHFTVIAHISSNQPHFKVLDGHIWLAATIRDSTVLPDVRMTQSWVHSQGVIGVQ